MSPFLKAAPAAALSLTLLAATSFSGAGFAFGAPNAEILAADTIKVDPAVLAADDKLRDDQLRTAATTETVDVKSLSNGDTIFAPGTGQPQAEIAVPEIDEERPVRAASLAELVRKHGAPTDLDAEARCLAGAVYFESKGESLEGQLAVARVVMARAKSGRFPSTICGVVHQKSQFSFVRGGRMPAINTGSLHWRNAVAISKIALDDSWKSPVEGALFFHARHVSPGWRLKRIGSVDNHIFYR